MGVFRQIYAMNTWSLCRFYSLHELKIKERMTNRLQTGYAPREDGPIAITIKEVQFPSCGLLPPCCLLPVCYHSSRCGALLC